MRLLWYYWIWYKFDRHGRCIIRGEKVLFVIITAGYENASRRYTEDRNRQRVEHQKQKHNWEFIFFGSDMDAAAEAEKLGTGDGRAQIYRADSCGIRAAYTAMSSASAAFQTGSLVNGMIQGKRVLSEQV